MTEEDIKEIIAELISDGDIELQVIQDRHQPPVDIHILVDGEVIAVAK